MDEMAIRTKV